MHRTGHLHKYVCKHCGGDEVLLGAEVKWNLADQKWEFYGELDHDAYNYCYSCEESGHRIDSQELTDLKSKAQYAILQAANTS